MAVHMKLTPAQVSFAVEVLYKARTDKQVKLRFGARKRDALVQAYATDRVNKEDYRYVWIKEARNRIVQILGQEGERLNKEHPYDYASVGDFIDILESALLLLKAHN